MHRWRWKSGQCRQRRRASKERSGGLLARRFGVNEIKLGFERASALPRRARSPAPRNIPRATAPFLNQHFRLQTESVRKHLEAAASLSAILKVSPPRPPRATLPSLAASPPLTRAGSPLAG